MIKMKILYTEKAVIYAEYTHPQSDEYIEYKGTITIKDSGKEPISIKMKLNDYHVSFSPMPPEEKTIKAKDLIHLYLKIRKYLKKYGYILESED
jgi:hypothetical protein